MARKQTATVEPAPIVIAIESHFGPHGLVRRGDRLRSDQPQVRHAPHLFLNDGSSDQELHEAQMALRPGPEDWATDDTRMIEPLRDEHAVRAKVSKRIPYDGKGSVSITEGDKLPRSHPLVGTFPDLFEPWTDDAA